MSGAASTRASTPAPAPAGRGSYALSDEACRVLLRDIGWGVLSVIEDAAALEARPYGVPVAYAFDGDAVYVATRGGRKLRAIEDHPLFCLTVLDVERFDRWRSVVMTGRPAWLENQGDRAIAIQAFAAQRRPGGMRLTRRDTERLLAARIMRMEVRDVSGRACGAWPEVPGGEARAATPVAAEDDDGDASQMLELSEEPKDGAARVMDDMRRIVRALQGASLESQRDLGVSGAQLFVLRQIAARASQSMTDVARLTHTTQSSVSEVVARLVRGGLVERRPAADDRRRAELTLTAAGRAILRRAPDTVQERLLAGYGRLSPAQQQLLSDGLAAWLREAGLGGVPPTMFLETPGADEEA